MFERRHQDLISPRAFLQRQALFTAIAVAIVFGSLLLGVLGYHGFEGLPWIDALVNAAMILGGMGPVDPLRTTSGKIFATFYALYSGVIFLLVAGVLFAPLFHRFLHHFHLELDGDDSGSGAASPSRRRGR